MAGLTVAFLTPSEVLYRAELTREQRDVLLDEDGVRLKDIPESMESVHASARKASESWFVDRFTGAFGKGCGSFALVIAMAAII
ncbi:MAG: hypothetical protein ABL994_06600 [Verrucomicrobiales bacterium]